MKTQFADPMSVSPAVLSWKSAKWLVDARELSPWERGLFGGLTPPGPHAPQVPRELAALGLGGHRLGRPTREQELIRVGLQIAAQPERKVVCTSTEPDKKTERLQFFVRQGLATLAWFDELAYYVGPAFPLVTLQAAVSKFVHSVEFELPLTTIPSALLRVLSALFPQEPRPRPMAEVISKLKPGHGEPWVGQLVALNLLEQRGELCGPSPIYQAILENLHSGYFAQLEYDELGARTGAPERHSLVFVGPPGRRLWTFDIENDGEPWSCFQAFDYAEAAEIASPLT